MNIALYMRMSTDKQDNSIESQEEALIKYAKTNRLIIVEKYIDEGISGREALKRPAFLKMIDESEKKIFEAVLVYDSSRFARNLEESIVYKSTLKRNGVALISATEPTLDDDTSIITDAMLGALNEMFSRKLSKSVKRGMLFNAQKGVFQNPPPYGYRKKDGVTTVVEEQAALVKYIFELFLEKQSYYSVAVKLNELGKVTRAGKGWRATDIKRMLNNRAYIGEVYYMGRYYKGEHSPIIDLSDFENAQSVINEKPESKQRPALTYKHWLSGLLKCFSCGGAMNHVTDSRGNRSYRCSGHSSGRCRYSNFMSVYKLEKIMSEVLKDVVRDKNFDVYQFFVPKINNNEIDFIEEALKKLDAKLTRVKAAYANGIDTMEEYKDNKAVIQKEITVLKNEINKLNQRENKTAELEDTKNKVCNLIQILESDSFSTEQKSIAIKKVVGKIVFNKYAGEFTVYYFL